MKRIILIIAALLLPGGIVVLIFREWRLLKIKILEFFASLKQKFLS